MNDAWNWDAAAEVLPRLLEAFFQVTLLVTVIGTAIAAVLGLAVAIVRRLAPRWVAAPVHAVMEFIRMTPLVLQLLLPWYIFVDLPAIWIGTVVIGIHYATYMAESYRAGIDSVPKGQWEAATALSMSPTRTWRKVVIPQALRATIPSLGNWAISMFKETPFLFVISVVEMVTRAQRYGSNTFNYIEPFTMAALIFLAASYPTSILVRRLETRLAY